MGKYITIACKVRQLSLSSSPQRKDAGTCPALITNSPRLISTFTPDKQNVIILGLQDPSLILVLAVIVAKQSCALNPSSCCWKMMVSVTNLCTDSGRSA